jgi:exosortase
MKSNSNAPFKINVKGIITLILAVFIAFLFIGTSQTYLNTWLKFDESMGHALLIVTMVSYLLLKPQPLINNKTATNKKHLWLIPIVLVVLFHQISNFWGILVFQQFSLYILWLLAIYYVLGRSYFKKNIFPLLFFLFAVPFWEFLNPIFLNITTFAVTYLLDFTPVVAFIDGNRIELPYGMLEIAGGCSGLRYFEIGLALSLFAVSVENISFKLKCLVVLLGTILGVVTNWIRVISLIWVGYDSKMTSSLMNDHETHGLILFMLVIAPLLFFINWLSANYALNNKTQEGERPPTHVNTINKTTWTFLSLFVLGTISTVWLTNIGSTSQINIGTNQPKDKHQLLSSYGNYKQIITSYTEAENCNLITREYQFLEAGKNSLPLNQLYNSISFDATTPSTKSLSNYENNAKVNYLLLENKKTKQQAELYYWYKYGEIKVTNNYLAKLTEIVFLFNKQSKITLNIVICPAQ